MRDCSTCRVLALEAADGLGRKLGKRQVVAAALTNAQTADYAAAVESLAPFNVSLPTAASTLADCLRLVGDLANATTRQYEVRHSFRHA